jgi:hypothetical protein
MFVMYDSVDLNQIPKQPHAIACYRNGDTANEHQARLRFPHARILPISVTGAVPCECYDIERGDYTPDHVPELLRLALHEGITRPCFYASLSVMPEIHQQLKSTGIPRTRIRLWVAYYNGNADLPAEYDAHQFTNRALGRNLDESICSDTFFAPASLPKHSDTHRAEIDYDIDTHTWSIRATADPPDAS